MVNQIKLLRASLQEIAMNICDELETRGFATDMPLQERELEQWIFNLLNDRLIGNVNVTDVGPNGWEGDLTNQL